MKPVNRVLLAFRTWDEQKAELKPLINNSVSDEKTLQGLQLVHLQQARHRLIPSVRPDERPFLTLLENQIRRLEKQVYPNVWSRLIQRLKDRYLDGPAYLKAQAHQRAANMESLKDQLRERGLSSVAGRLEHHLDPDQRLARLPLNSQLGAEKRLDLDLHFEQDVYGNFQLQRLAATLLQKDQDDRHFQFELWDWPGLKADQALSLLEGRALKQTYTDATGHENQRWVELGQEGIKYYSPEHPFDIASAISAFPNITCNQNELLRQLGCGQQVSTHWKHDGHFQAISVQADPPNHTLKLFDAKQKPITAELLDQRAKQLRKVKHPVQRLEANQKKFKNGHQIS